MGVQDWVWGHINCLLNIPRLTEVYLASVEGYYLWYNNDDHSTIVNDFSTLRDIHKRHSTLWLKHQHEKRDLYLLGLVTFTVRLWEFCFCRLIGKRFFVGPCTRQYRSSHFTHHSFAIPRWSIEVSMTVFWTRKILTLVCVSMSCIQNGFTELKISWAFIVPKSTDWVPCLDYDNFALNLVSNSIVIMTY